MAELAGSLKADDPICEWPKAFGYAPKCPDNSVFTACANLCSIKTCAYPNGGNNCPANGRLTSMCVCKDGFVMDNGKCIPASDCGCKLKNGGYVSQGVYENCKTRCECNKDGDYLC